MTPLCLVLARDHELLESLRLAVRTRELTTFGAGSAEAAFGLVAQWRFDVVVVDGDGFLLSLPGLLQNLRIRIGAPILVLIGRHDEESQIAALDCGAADVMAKPISARLIATKLLRLSHVGLERHRMSAPAIELGSLKLDPGSVTASVDEATLALTGGEFDLLYLLASRPGQVVYRDEVRSKACRQRAVRRGTRSTDMHACRIRQKLRDAGAHDLVLDTLYGRGYVLRCVTSKNRTEPVPTISRTQPGLVGIGAGPVHAANVIGATVHLPPDCFPSPR